jgi:receptor protein-tyrosine kinase/non-specific protein-tyrosine kinase
MEPSAETRTLRGYLHALKTRRRLIVVTTLVAAAAALLLSLAREPVYEATATISFTAAFKGASPNVPGSAGVEGAVVVTRNDVLQSASEELDGELNTPDEIRSHIEALATRGVNTVTVTAEADSGEEAADVANAVAEATQTILREESQTPLRLQLADTDDPELQKALRSQLRLIEPVEIVEEAEVPDAPESPKPLRDTVFAALLGFLLGIVIALVRYIADRRVTDPREVQAQLRAPLVGQIRSDMLGMRDLSENGGPVSDDDLEPFRILRANAEFLAKDESLRTVAVTSPLAEEGKSTVAAFYAYVNALAGRRTILIECDLRRPVLSSRFGFEETPGLSDYLLDQAKPRDVLRSVRLKGPTAEPLPVIPGGTTATQPAEMLASTRFEEFLAQVAKAYELVVLDCPPLLPVGDTLELLPRVDAVLLCVRLGQTTREQAVAAKNAIDHLPPRPVGIVVTGLDPGGADDYYGYYSVRSADA